MNLNRQNTSVFLVGMLLVAAAGLASADTVNVPDPALCSVQPSDDLGGAVLAPDMPSANAASINVIEVRNTDNNPIPDAAVSVTFGPNHIICPDTVLSGNTNASGLLTIVFAGGGCTNDMPTGCIIRTNGVDIRHYYNAKSPDYDGAGGDLVVNLGDLVSFSASFLGALGGCHDYDNSGACGLPDLITFADSFLIGAHCP